jgi:hypothetical protein
MHAIPVFARMRQEDQEFKVSLGCLIKNKQKNNLHLKTRREKKKVQ